MLWLVLVLGGCGQVEQSETEGTLLESDCGGTLAEYCDDGGACPDWAWVEDALEGADHEVLRCDDGRYRVEPAELDVGATNVFYTFDADHELLGVTLSVDYEGFCNDTAFSELWGAVYLCTAECSLREEPIQPDLETCD